MILYAIILIEFYYVKIGDKMKCFNLFLFIYYVIVMIVIIIDVNVNLIG